MTIDLFRRTYTEFWDTVESGSIDALCDMMPYDYNVNGQGGIWGSFVSEFTRELLNTINGLASQINSLNIWLNVLNSKPDDEQFPLRYEFTRLPLNYCLHKPREFRERLIFCLSHLCHQADTHTQPGYRDRLEPDHRIGIDTLRRVASPWASALNALEAISQISSSNFDQSTGQFRNRTQHRIPPSLEYGHTNLVTRNQTPSGEVSYSFGFSEPITTEAALPLLIEQWELMRSGFERYWQVVEEQNLTIQQRRAQ
ncbi:hypothetical protein SHLO109777_05825 [Shewanella loihica]|nr:hypothetical protein [Shewanella loihica]